MGIFRQFPYTNFHEINLDWLLSKVHTLEDDMANFMVDTINTIVNTVNTWLDDHPEATTTVQDWSLTNKKLVKGTLNFITPEMFGAVGDGITDDYEAIQESIDYAIQHNLTLRASGKYRITTGLFVRGLREEIDGVRVLRYGDAINIDFSTAKIIYEGYANAITIDMINSGYLNIGRIEAEHGNGVFVYSYSIFNFINYLTIDGVSIKANTTKDGILILNESGGWNNQNVIKNIRFTGGLYGIHFKNMSTNKINEWYIDNVAFEGVSNGFYLEAVSDEDTLKYIGYITINRPRCIELIGTYNGKLLTTYGRVRNVIMDISYINDAQIDETAFLFEYDNNHMGDEGTQIRNYLHGTQNVRIYTASRQLVVNNNKITSNPYMFASACNVDNIADDEDLTEENTIYRNWFGTLADFVSKIPSLFLNTMETSLYGNLNSYWLSGTPTDIATTRNIVQKLITSHGFEFTRNIRNGVFNSSWLMTPKIKYEHKVLHDNTFEYPVHAIGLLFIFNTNASVLTIYSVRFGTNTTPTKIFSNDTAADWVITKDVDNKNIIHFSRETTPETEYNIAFVNLA